MTGTSVEEGVAPFPIAHPDFFFMAIKMHKGKKEGIEWCVLRA